MRFEANVSGNERIQKALRELAESINPQMKRELMRKIGIEYVLFVETEVFDKQRSHQRKKWKELSPVTIEAKKKKGSRRGPGFIGTWTGDLVDSQTFRVVGDSVFIGSDVPYAPFFHFFVKKGRNKGGPWGDIPARPFLGVSERADKRILKVMNKFFSTDIIK
jgi:phage virion morphogenesis protein